MKKLSKRLLAMLLVAVMVAAAIPFGAFAADQPYELIVKKDGVVIFDSDITYDDSVALPSDAATANALLALAGLSESVGSGYDLDAVVDSRSAGKIGVKITTSPTPPCTHTWVFNGTVGNGSTHTELCTTCSETRSVDCTIVTTAEVPATCTTVGKTEYKECSVCGWNNGGAQDIPALGHTDANEDGTCDVCGATGLPVSKKTYTVTVDYGTTTASGHSEEFTDSQITANFGSASALRNYLSGLGGNYATIAAQMANADYSTDKLIVNSVGGTIYVNMKSAGGSSEPDPDPADEDILVIRDDGYEYFLQKEGNVGRYYSNILQLGNTWGTKQAVLKIKDANGYRSVKWDSRTADAKVRQTDTEVWILGNNKTVTIYYLKSATSNPTTTNAFATRKYEFNTQLGTLPDLPSGYTAWYVNGWELSENTVYNWETDYVYAYPGNGEGTGRVHLFIYNNNKGLMKNVDVTDNVQSNGILAKSDLLKTVEYQTGHKNPSMVMFDEDGWAYYLNNKKSTAKAMTEIDVGTADERVGTQNIYIVLTGVSGSSNADTSNPKTGDNAMLGTAAIVMALAVVGLGTVFFMKKREKI